MLRRSTSQLLLVVAAAVLPYLNAVPADFTFDDIGVIRDNAAVQALPAADLLRYVHQPGALYRPLTMLSYAANASVSPAPFGFHLVNVVLHALVSVAVWLLARTLLGGTVAPTAAAVLFAVHPIHTEAVTNIVGRAELLAALGVLVALLADHRARHDSGTTRRAWLALSLAAYAAAMLAKESAFTGLGLLAVVQWWSDRSATLRQRAVALLPYAVVAAGYLVLRMVVVGSLSLPAVPGSLDNPLAHVDEITRIRTAVVVLAQYAQQLTVPLHLSADYSFNQIPVALTWSDPRVLSAALLCAALAVAAIAAARRAPQLTLAAAFALIPLLLTANLLFPIGTIKAERLLYLPSVGWCFAAAWLIAAAARRRQTAAIVAVAVLVTAFGVRAWVRNRDWRDEATLHTATLHDAPRSAKARFNYAVALERAGRLDDALLEFRRTLDIYPDYAGAAYGIGDIYASRSVIAGAVYWYEAALRLDPKFVPAHLQLGLLRQATGEYDAAEAAFASGLASDPKSPMLLVNLSAVRMSQGDRWRAQAALIQLDRIGTIDPQERALVSAARREIEVALR